MATYINYWSPSAINMIVYWRWNILHILHILLIRNKEQWFHNGKWADTICPTFKPTQYLFCTSYKSQGGRPFMTNNITHIVFSLGDITPTCFIYWLSEELGTLECISIQFGSSLNSSHRISSYILLWSRYWLCKLEATHMWDGSHLVPSLWYPVETNLRLLSI